MNARKSQCDLVLEILADHQPHGYREIHERAGFMRLNSRVAELRSRGHRIVCDKHGRDFIYTLEPPLNESAVDSRRRDPADSLNGVHPGLRTDGISAEGQGHMGAAQLQLGVGA